MEESLPICLSITGEGVRATPRITNEHIPLKIFFGPPGRKAFDWNVPKEWNIRNAYVCGEHGNKLVDFKESNLHVVEY